MARGRNDFLSRSVVLFSNLGLSLNMPTILWQ